MIEQLRVWILINAVVSTGGAATDDIDGNDIRSKKSQNSDLSNKDDNDNELNMDYNDADADHNEHNEHSLNDSSDGDVTSAGSSVQRPAGISHAEMTELGWITKRVIDQGNYLHVLKLHDDPV